jgi:RNA-directed DNA polymerase
LSQAEYRATLIRINQIQRGWANYFKHAVAKHTFDKLRAFVWWRVVHWVMHRQRMRWRAVQRWLRRPTGWRSIVLDGIELFNIAATRVSRYRLRGNTIPSPWPIQATDQKA